MPLLTRICLFFLFWGGFVLTISGAEPRTVHSRGYPLEVRATSNAAIDRILLYSEEAVERTLDRMKISFTDIPFMILFIQTEEPPLLPDFETFPRTLRLGPPTENNPTGRVMRIFISGNPARERERIVRTTVVSLLQGYEYGDDEFHDGEKMSDPPVWLTEGITQSILKENQDLFRKITHHYLALDRAPMLPDIEKWKDLGGDRLMKLWRQAFCGRLLEAAVASEDDRKAVLLWLRHHAAEGAAYWSNPELSNVWWKDRLAEEPKLSTPILDFQSSAQALERALTFKARKVGEEVRSVYQVRDLPPNPAVLARDDVDDAVLNLAQSQGMISPLFTDTMTYYNQAFSFWRSGEYPKYQNAIRLASHTHADVLEFMKRVGQRMDWFEVNFPAPSIQTDLARFRNIFEFDPPQSIPEKDVIHEKLTVVEEGKP